MSVTKLFLNAKKRIMSICLSLVGEWENVVGDSDILGN